MRINSSTGRAEGERGRQSDRTSGTADLYCGHTLFYHIQYREREGESEGKREISPLFFINTTNKLIRALFTSAPHTPCVPCLGSAVILHESAPQYTSSTATQREGSSRAEVSPPPAPAFYSRSKVCSVLIRVAC